MVGTVACNTVGLAIKCLSFYSLKHTVYIHLVNSDDCSV